MSGWDGTWRVYRPGWTGELYLPVNKPEDSAVQIVGRHKGATPSSVVRLSMPGATLDDARRACDALYDFTRRTCRIDPAVGATHDLGSGRVGTVKAGETCTGNRPWMEIAGPGLEGSSVILGDDEPVWAEPADPEHGLVCSTGAQIGGMYGTVTVGNDGHLFTGYDDRRDGEDLTPAERRALAEFMIARWRRWGDG